VRLGLFGFVLGLFFRGVDGRFSSQLAIITEVTVVFGLFVIGFVLGLFS